MEATAVPVLRQSLSLSASTVVCDPTQFSAEEMAEVDRDDGIHVEGE